MSNNATSSPGSPRWVRLALLAFFLCLGYLVAVAFDGPVFHAMAGSDTHGEDWHRLLRVMGYAPTWLVVAAILALIDRRMARRVGWFKAMWRPGLLILAVILSGIAAEVLKILIRRERPLWHDGDYVLRSWFEDPFYSGGLATPSSHAAVAFGAAFMMMHLVPQAKWVWLLLAVGCALTRVMAQAHMVSDTYLSAVVSALIVHLLWQQHLRNNPGFRREYRVLFEPVK